MATTHRHSRRNLWSRRDPLWVRLFFLLVVWPVLYAVFLPVWVVHRFRNYVRRRQYVVFDGTKECVLRAAVRRAPLVYRWFGRSLSVDQLDALFSESGLEERWLAVKSSIESGDKIWPFTINPYSLAMREGFVFVRRGQPVDLMLTTVS